MPLLLKQAVAVIDGRTTVVCLHVSGQIQPIEKPFETLNGEYQTPPFHVHCRTHSVPWMAGFVNDLRDQANQELLKRPPSQRRMADGRTPIRIPDAKVTVEESATAKAARQRWTDAIDETQTRFTALYREQAQISREAVDTDDRQFLHVGSEWKTGEWRRIQELLLAGRRTGEIDGRYYRTLEEFLADADEAFERIDPTRDDMVLVRNTSAGFSSIDALLHSEPGTLFEFPGYTATSAATHRDLTLMSLSGDVEMEILIPTGSQVLSIDGMAFSGINGEMEVLINRGAQFVLAERPVEVGGKWHVRLVLVS